MRSPTERLRDILEAAEKISQYTADGDGQFRGEELVQTWVLWHLQVIGEASAALPEQVRTQAPEVPWSRIVGMRNILVHQYFGVDLDVVWLAVSRDLPTLVATVTRLLDEGV
ncbi:MAG: DUF86 domain-containing protein [Armatimonadetes bacterium]|nr:DUF86 domain-containing protein [Armatimonadota bacterium]